MIRWRYRRILFFFARLLLSLTVWDIIFPRFGLRKLSLSTRPKRLRSASARYRLMATQLGGVLIKVGQFLSSRVDVLPNEVTSELSGLQDEVPAESFESVRQVAEAEFGMPLEEKYTWFDPAPLAAASLGQVHLAKQSLPLPEDNGEEKSPPESNYELREVVVKIQRPDIETLIATDLAALRTVGKWIHRYPAIRKRANVPELLGEFTRTLYEEIDYLAEGRNAETFAANFTGQSGVLVPHVIWSHTTKRVLTLENVQGIKITDYAAISAAGVSRPDVASRLLNTYLQQIFQDGFFHADPHPGNLFIRINTHKTDDEKSVWQLTFVDFGMVGHIPPGTRAGFRELLIGVATRDASRVVRSYQMLGVLLPGADLNLIEQAENMIFDKFWGKNMSEITSFSVQDMREYAHQFRQLIYSMPFQVPQDIIFLVRAVGILSGMCTGLDPDFNVWEHLAPYSKRLIAEEISTSSAGWKDNLAEITRKIIAFPHRVDSLIDRLENGKLTVRNPDLISEVKQLKKAIMRMNFTMLFAPALLAAVFLYLSGELLLAGLLLLFTFLTWIWMSIRTR